MYGVLEEEHALMLKMLVLHAKVSLTDTCSLSNYIVNEHTEKTNVNMFMYTCQFCMYMTSKRLFLLFNSPLPGLKLSMEEKT